MRTNVTFDSGGIKLAGALHTPDAAPKKTAGASQ
jgi:hypothetical protein